MYILNLYYNSSMNYKLLNKCHHQPEDANYSVADKTNSVVQKIPIHATETY